MSAPGLGRLLAAVDATWPPAEIRETGGWVLRRGDGGGKRVSAASLGAGAHADALPEIGSAEQAMAGWGQPALFRLAPGLGAAEAALDAALAAMGYGLVEDVALYRAPVALLCDGSDETARIIRVGAPLGLVDEIWAAGGIGPARRRVMARVGAPCRVLMARLGDRPVGVAFVARQGPLAMIHAIEVLAEARRRGAGEMLLRGAASFAAEAGVDWLALAVSGANRPAHGLYAKLGMEIAGRCHYRLGRSMTGTD